MGALEFGIEPSLVPLGVSEVDRDHHELETLLAQLSIASVDGNREHFTKLFNDMIEHSRDHFAREEILMRKGRCPSLELHSQEHKAILDRLARYAHALMLKRQLLRLDEIRALGTWLQRHADTADKNMAAHLRRHYAPSGISV
ncbi:MAG: hemerythrin family protein [Rhodospirillaceae bacterium]|nr:hemerythrin family protein [Rhodospirillaceae bacterium]